MKGLTHALHEKYCLDIINISQIIGGGLLDEFSSILFLKIIPKNVLITIILITEIGYFGSQKA